MALASAPPASKYPVVSRCCTALKEKLTKVPGKGVFSESGHCSSELLTAYLSATDKSFRHGAVEEEERRVGK